MFQRSVQCSQLVFTCVTIQWYNISYVLYFDNKNPNICIKAIYGIFPCKISNIIYKCYDEVYNVINLHFSMNFLFCIALLFSFPTILPTAATMMLFWCFDRHVTWYINLWTISWMLVFIQKFDRGYKYF